MDPALWELLREEGADTQRPVEAIIRLARPGIEIPDVRVVSRFGSIVTCRIPAADVIAVRSHPCVVSVKAARRLGVGRTADDTAGRSDSASLRATDLRRPPGMAPTGAGVVVGCVDWGADIDSPTFRYPPPPGALPRSRAGGTRFLALWDQRDQATGESPDPYGYGALHDRAGIDRALQQPRPYDALGYHPAVADRGRGTHGTHVLDIAAGNGRAGGPLGIAPKADLVFVHLADRDTGGLANLGDSVRLLEAIDFIRRTAGGRPCVINTSVGRHGGPHDGTTLAELAVDQMLSTTPGLLVVKSTGNYYRARAHASGMLTPNESTSLEFVVDPEDATPNELEIWYDGGDELGVRLTPPGQPDGPWVSLGNQAELTVDGGVVGRIYHRAADPNNGANHVDAFLYPPGCGGTWAVTLEARRVRSGRFHAWLERDDFCPRCQTRFAPPDSDPASTTGTLANGHLDLSVGAFDGHDPARPPGPFSSAGPTRDGRPKPDLAAPGVNVLAARSAPADAATSHNLLVRKSGTSMAAPHVTGAVALCLQLGLEAGRLLSAAQVRALVLSSCDPPPQTGTGLRLGHGYLNIPRLLTATRDAVPVAGNQLRESLMATDPIPLLAAAPATAYRELLYRPGGQLARVVDDRYDVLAHPGRRPDQTPRGGDVLLRVDLGRLDRGRCTVLDDSQALRMPPRLLPGHLLLRPRQTVPLDRSASDPDGLPVPDRGRELDGDDAEDTELDRLIDRGLSENQITNALYYARNPRQVGLTLSPGSNAAREWQALRGGEVRPAVRGRVRATSVDPVELAVFLSQYENDDRVPAATTTRFLTGSPLLSLGRSLRDRVLGNWRRGAAPLTARGMFGFALELAGDAGIAALLCHNVTKAFVREGVAITWRGTGTEGEYTDGQKTFQARRINRSGRLTYRHPTKKRDVVSIFYLLFSDGEFGTDDPGDWYHFFVTATMTTLSSGGTLGPTGGRGRRGDIDGAEAPEGRGGRGRSGCLPGSSRRAAPGPREADDGPKLGLGSRLPRLGARERAQLPRGGPLRHRLHQRPIRCRAGEPGPLAGGCLRAAGDRRPSRSHVVVVRPRRG